MEKLTTRSSPADLKAVRDFLVKQEHPDLLVSRLGRQPTAAEIQAATRRTQVVLQADWRGLNAILANYDLPATVEQRPERTEVKRGQKQRSTTQDAAAALAVIKLATQELRRAFGPIWRQVPASEKEGLAYEVYSRWLASRQPGPPTVSDLQIFVREVYRETRQAQQEQGLGQEVDKKGAKPPEEETESALGPRDRALHALRSSEDPTDRLQALIIDLHLGSYVLPDQPVRLTGQTPVRDLERHHPGGGLACPTCRNIARLVRVRRLEPDMIGRAVDDFTIKLQEEIGG